MTNSPHDFDVLDQWATMSDQDMPSVISQDSIDVLKRVGALLYETGRPAPRMEQDTFVEIVRELRHLKHEGSRTLGDAILKASDYADKNQNEEARSVYNQFLQRCVSPFYSGIAENQIRKIEQ